MIFNPSSNGAGMTVEGVSVEHDGYRALSDVTFHVDGGTLMGVVGPNGAGKSTLFNAIAGVLPLRKGRIVLHGMERRRVCWPTCPSVRA